MAVIRRGRRGRRTYIRENFSCEPGGCGAKPGEHCRAYVQKKGKTTGNQTGDVHAARWAAFRARFESRPGT